MAFLRTLKKDEVPPGTIREFQIEGKVLAVSNVDGKICAINNVCLHRGGTVGGGRVEWRRW